MRLPTIQGVIDRRILVNYRVDPRVAARLLPAPFRPKLADGHAMGGICLIRLRQIRPSFLLVSIGLGSENAAHRFAVEWDENGTQREGVFIPRRDTSSRLNTAIGGRLFPGVHHHARFRVSESDQRVCVGFESDDGITRVLVVARPSESLSQSSVFGSLDEASRFFEGGALGYSVTRDAQRFDGLELRCRTWAMQPLVIETAISSYFDDHTIFPKGSVQLDCALLMRGIEHEWCMRDQLNAARLTSTRSDKE